MSNDAIYDVFNRACSHQLFIFKSSFIKERVFSVLTSTIVWHLENIIKDAGE